MVGEGGWWRREGGGGGREGGRVAEEGGTLNNELTALVFCSSTPDGSTIGINRNNLLLRGCVVRNTPLVFGVVVYAGRGKGCCMWMQDTE